MSGIRPASEWILPLYSNKRFHTLDKHPESEAHISRNVSCGHEWIWFEQVEETIGYGGELCALSTAVAELLILEELDQPVPIPSAEIAGELPSSRSNCLEMVLDAWSHRTMKTKDNCSQSPATRKEGCLAKE